MSRNFFPKAEVLGEDKIILRPFDHVMEYYVGLDVSLKQTSICVADQTVSSAA